MNKFGGEIAGTGAAAATNAIAAPVAATDPHSQYATDVQFNQLQTAVNSKKAIGVVTGLIANLTAVQIPLMFPIGATIDFKGLIAANGILNENGLIWLLLDGATIGNTASGASHYADAKARLLFERLWANGNLGIFNSFGIDDTKGGSAAADFDANKRLALPDLRGRVIIPAGSGIALTPRVWGVKGGAETHTLTISQIPSHSHIQSLGGALTNYVLASGAGTEGTANTSSTQAAGGGSAHNNMPPYYVSAGKLILVGKS